jgi:hypothetical protein
MSEKKVTNADVVSAWVVYGTIFSALLVKLAVCF